MRFRGVGVIPAVIVFAVAPLAPASPASATKQAANKPCVAVIVDASRAGGGVRTGCARSDPPTGFAALRSAGFSFRLRPDGLLCQINSRPGECVASTQRYWSYWYRAPGSSRWTYSSTGPGAHNPRPGSTEGWVFQTDGGQARPPNIRQATICPVAVRPAVTSSSPRVSSSRPAARKTSRARSPAAPPKKSTKATTGSAAVKSSASATPSTSHVTTASAPAATTAAKSPDPIAATPTAGREDDRDGGPSIAFLAAVVLIITISVATVVRAKALSRR